MNIKCLFGHKWNGCKCSICSKIRNKEHDWSLDCNRCSICGKTRTKQHDWNGCKCSICKKTRDIEHDLSSDNAICSICGEESPILKQNLKILSNPKTKFFDFEIVFKKIGTHPMAIDSLISRRCKLLNTWPWSSNFLGGGGGPDSGEQLIVDITKIVGVRSETKILGFLNEIKKRTQEYSGLNDDEWYQEKRGKFITDIDEALAQCQRNSYFIKEAKKRAFPNAKSSTLRQGKLEKIKKSKTYKKTEITYEKLLNQLNQALEDANQWGNENNWPGFKDYPQYITIRDIGQQLYNLEYSIVNMQRALTHFRQHGIYPSDSSGTGVAEKAWAGIGEWVP